MFGVLKYRYTFPSVTPQGGRTPCDFFAQSFVKRCIAVATPEDKRETADYALGSCLAGVFAAGEKCL